LIAIAIYIVVAGGYASFRHAAFQTQAYDLGLFVQSFWNTIHGHPFVNSFEEGSHFRTHFTPFLFLLVPFYWLFPSPYTLLWLQTVALGIAAWPLYWLARDRIGPTGAMATMVAYLLYPWLHAINRFDFHEEPFAVPLLLGALLAFERRRIRTGVALLALAASTKENSLLTVWFVGVFLIGRPTTRRLGLVLTLVAGIAFFTIIRGMLADRAGVAFRVRYGDLGGTPFDLVVHLLSNPGAALVHLPMGPRLLYLMRLLAPIGFLPLLAPFALLPALPGVVQNLFSRVDSQISNQYQYDSLILPFLFVAVIAALQRTYRADSVWRRRLPSALVLVSIGAYTTVSPLRPSELARLPSMLRIHSSDLGVMLKQVPRRGSVAASTRLIPHICQRDSVYIISTQPLPTDIIAIDGTEIFPFETRERFQAYVDSLNASAIYTSQVFGGRYLLMVRKGYGGYRPVTHD
jgi:uncharacterized membrane protein